MHRKPKIIIIGGGFGGIAIAKCLSGKPVDVLVLDQNNYHNFQPLMYQVATGGLEPGSIAYPVRRIFRAAANITFRMGEVFTLGEDQRSLLTSVGVFKFDYLIIATGSQNNYYNFEPVKSQLLSLKSIPDALNLRSYVFQNLEKALSNYGRETLEEIVNIAIVGGGPAGLELAGALAEMKRFVLPKDFPELDLSRMHINLYQSPSRLLNNMSEEASAKSLEYLQDLGVNVFLNSRVTGYDGDNITLADGSTFLTDTVIWTAGVKGAPIGNLPSSCMAGGDRIRINEFNQVEGIPQIFAIGDVAAHITDEHPQGLPMLAPVAQQQGRHLAGNLLALIRNKPMKPFSYKDKGVMATIGRQKAVVDLPNYKFQGTFAWILWMLLHIFALVGYRNKLMAFIDWFVNYLNYDRPLGLIIRPFNRKNPKGLL